MTSHTLSIAAIVIISLCVCTSIALIAIKRMRRYGIVMFLGSALILTGLLSNERFHSTPILLALNASGSVILFMNSWISAKRRYS